MIKWKRSISDMAMLVLAAFTLNIAAEVATAEISGDSASQTQKATFVLDKVKVTAGARRLSRKETENVARMPLHNLENPQAYSVVPKELTQEQMAVDYRSAFKNVPGAGPANTATNGRNFFTSRGFTTANLIRNGMVSWVYSEVDPSSIERIEAIRGPSGTLFGGSVISYGGLINRVSKRPFEEFRGEVSYSGGAWNLARYTADVNVPLNTEKTALLRVNAASHEEESFQDAGFTKSLAFAPSFSYRINDRLSVLIDADWNQREATGIIPSFAPTGITDAKSMDELGMDPERSFTNNTLTSEFPAFNANGQVDYLLGSGWTSRTQYAMSTIINDERGIWGFAAINNDSASRTYGEYHMKRNSQQIQQNFLGDFNLGPVRNRLLLGLDFYTTNVSSTSHSGVLDTLDFRNPGAAYLNTSSFNASNKAAAYPVTWNRGESFTYSTYVTDVINPVERLSILLGLRMDKFDNRGSVNQATGVRAGIYEQKAFSPKAGLVYQVVKDQVSLFANYMNGFVNVSGADFSGNAFSPEQANQWEVGVKSEAFGGGLVGTASYYDITVDEKIRTDPDHPTFSKQDGRQVSNGVELELAATPYEGLILVAGYAYNDSKMEKAAENINGLRPINSGAEHAANVWASYRLSSGPAKGLGGGLGANYLGEQFVVNTTAKKFTVPEYATVDVTVFYDHPAYRFGFKVDNLTDEVYWNGWGSPQAPRRLTGNVAYKF